MFLGRTCNLATILKTGPVTTAPVFLFAPAVMDVEVAARNFVDHDGRLQNLDELVRMVNSLQPSYPPPAAHEIQ